MIQRYYFGARGALDVRRFWLRAGLTLIWIAVSAVELVLTARNPRTYVLSYLWAACLVFWVTMGAFGVRLYLERRRTP